VDQSERAGRDLQGALNRPAGDAEAFGMDAFGMDAATLTALAELTVGDALGRLPLATQVFVGVLLVATALWTAARPGRTRAVAFGACALVWARANQGLEGFVLLTLSPGHGLTLADLLPPALLALVLARRAELSPRRARAAAGR
jgi:hypothetical protein